MLLMDIPTSQAQTSQPTLTLDECLSQLAAGTFAYGQLATFSDLPRDRIRRVAAIWPEIEHAVRRKLIAAAVDLGEDSVEYQFNRLFRLALTDEEADIRQLAITGLWEDESTSLLTELMSVAVDDDVIDVRAAALVHIGDAIPRLIDAGDDELVGRIGELVLTLAEDADESAIIRRRAIEAVGGLEQTDETRELILDAIDHGDQTLEAAALVAMGRSLESRWLGHVRASIADDDPEIRYEASRSLGAIGTTDDVAVLAERTLDEDSDVRRAAVMALGEIGGPGAVRILRNLTQHVDEAEYPMIEEALDNALLTTDALRLPS